MIDLNKTAEEAMQPITVGNRYGRLVVVAQNGRKNMGVAWLCRCECGVSVTATSSNLRLGHKKSCGCLRKDSITSRSITHGHNKNKKTTRVLKIWRGMIARCFTPSCPAYGDYGGRGITVCERWRNFQNFLADMGDCPQDMTIDRINNDGNYEPLNCRWATRREQARNKRNCHYFVINGERKQLTDACEEYGLKPATVKARLRLLGWSGARALGLEGRSDIEVLFERPPHWKHGT